MKIKLRSLSEIKPYEGNPRKISDEAVDAVSKSLEQFGFRQPIVVDADDVIIAGHTRYHAAVKLGLEKVPVHSATDLTADQVRAYRIADNASAEHSEWDFDLLPIEIEQLKVADYDLSLLGFDEEVNAILNRPPNSQESQGNESSSKEINPNEFSLECACPKCGFEFNPKT